MLYIYENEKMERCQNTIQIEDVQALHLLHPDKPHFTIMFQGLHKLKEMRIKCSTVEDRMRWMFSIECEMKRIKNDKKMKVLKMRDLTCNLIIDYDELNFGKDYFSYSNDRE